MTSNATQSFDSPEFQLIAAEIELPGLAQVLNDIREFDWKIINRLRKDDLDRIAGIGFQFKNRGIENRRQEFRAFLLEHPTLMSENFEHLMRKLSAYSQLLAAKNEEAQTEQRRKNSPPARKAIKHHPKKVVVVSDEEDYTDDSFVVSDDDDYDSLDLEPS